MRLTTAGRLTGTVAVLIVVAAAPGARAALHAASGPDFPSAAVALAHLAALAVSCWTLLVLVVGVLRLPLPGVPRRWAAVLFTTVVVSAVGGPAHADPGHDLEGLTLPDRPTLAARAPVTVTVVPGDTLWGIASDHLSPESTAADVAAACQRWHAANRDIIGSDPDLIHPGQVLVPPGAARGGA